MPEAPQPPAGFGPDHQPSEDMNNPSLFNSPACIAGEAAGHVAAVCVSARSESAGASVCDARDAISFSSQPHVARHGPEEVFPARGEREAPLVVDARDLHLLGAARQRNFEEAGKDLEQLRHHAARDAAVGDSPDYGDVHRRRIGPALEEVLLGRVGHGLVLHPQRLLLDQLRAGAMSSASTISSRAKSMSEARSRTQ